VTFGLASLSFLIGKETILKLPITITKRWKFHFLLLVFVIVCLLGCISCSQAQSSSANNQTASASDTAAIKNVVTDAFAATDTLVVVPDNPAAINALTPARISISLNDAASMKAPAQSVALARSRTQNSFKHSFTPNSAIGKQLSQELLQTIDAQSRGYVRALGGGIRDIHWHSILVNGDGASVTVDATLWSRVKYSDEFGKTHISAPTTSYTKDYTLRRINGQWLVSSVVDDNLQEG
jgi:hypothetical protein